MWKKQQSNTPETKFKSMRTCKKQQPNTLETKFTLDHKAERGGIDPLLKLIG